MSSNNYSDLHKTDSNSYYLSDEDIDFSDDDFSDDIIIKKKKENSSSDCTIKSEKLDFSDTIFTSSQNSSSKKSTELSTDISTELSTDISTESNKKSTEKSNEDTSELVGVNNYSSENTNSFSYIDKNEFKNRVKFSKPKEIKSSKCCQIL